MYTVQSTDYSEKKWFQFLRICRPLTVNEFRVIAGFSLNFCISRFKLGETEEVSRTPNCVALCDLQIPKTISKKYYAINCTVTA